MDQKGSHNLPGIYQLCRPTGTQVPLLVDSPHSGRVYPPDFGFSCPFESLQQAEDSHVDRLLDAVTGTGATLLCAHFPRTYIDANRAAHDIDTDLLAEKWPGPLMPTSRSHAGIGLIRRVVKPGMPVYNRRLSVAEIQNRLDRYYHPYHAALQATLDDMHYRFGCVWHLNMHSMPGPQNLQADLRHTAPDFVLGDRDGTSCAPDFTHMLRDTLKSMGYRVAVNNPYKGLEIVRRSARPAAGRHAIQIEISKHLYWDESRSEPNRNFARLKSDIDILTGRTADYIQASLSNMAAD